MSLIDSLVCSVEWEKRIAEGDRIAERDGDNTC